MKIPIILEETRNGFNVIERRVAYDIDTLIHYTRASALYEKNKIICELTFLDVRSGRNNQSLLFDIAREIATAKVGVPNNLMPFISQTALGLHKEIKVFGNDYETPDGTCIRDYIHVIDLVDGHIKAIDYALNNNGCEVFNLGRGKGISVLEMIEAFKKVNNIALPYSIAGRRPGDNAEAYADTAKAERLLGFKAEKTLEDMCRDTWNYQNND